MRCLLCEREWHGDRAAAYLCGGCTRATETRLGRMPRAYRALAAFLQPSVSRPEAGGTRPCEAPLPVSEPVLGLRGPGGIVGVLLDWERAVRDALGWTAPPFRGSTEQTVTGSARFLAGNLLWVAGGFPPAGDLAREVRELERDVLSIVDPADSRDQVRRLGYCPVETVEGRCGAVVSLRPGLSVARCEWCGAAWAPGRWVELAAAQEDSGTA